MEKRRVTCPTCGGSGVLEHQEEFDFEALYKSYPKLGPGKKRGMAKLRKICQSQKRYDDIKEAIRKLKSLKREKQFYPQWDTFINNYEDYLEIPDSETYNKPDPVHEFLEKARKEMEGLDNAE